MSDREYWNMLWWIEYAYMAKFNQYRIEPEVQTKVILLIVDCAKTTLEVTMTLARRLV